MSNELVQVEEIQTQVAPVAAMAGRLVVATPAQYAEAADFLKAVKAAQKQVEDWFADPVSKAHAAWKSLTTKKAETLAPLVEAERAVKGKMISWQTEQERIRRAEEAKLQAEADERARREREKIEAAARAQREREEAARRAEAEARARAAAAANEEARKVALAEAEKARKAAEAAAAKAEVREETAAQVIAPVVTVASFQPEIKGQSIRRTWKARVTDPRAAVAAIMAWPDWHAYVEINGGELNRFAARTKGAVAVPGVEWFEDAVLSSTGK